MTVPEYSFVPVVHDGIVATAPDVSLQVTMANGVSASVLALGRTGKSVIEPRPQADMTLALTRDGEPLAGSPLQVQCGGWGGRVDWARGGLLSGWARNLRHPSRDALVVAYSGHQILALASARSAENGQFLLRLPASVTGSRIPMAVTLGILGSDFLLDGGQLRYGGFVLEPSPAIVRRPLLSLSIRLKISTPNLKEAPMWGDYHFANSLTAAFERLGHQATVDTADAWYAQTADEDVVVTIRGRHRVKIDRRKINVMWLISHPDRIPEDEYEDYDHIYVASDIYCAELIARGLPSVSVMHQATDATRFSPDIAQERKPTCLFVGNSRKEYRTMVKWCVRNNIPLDLYGGGWEGILPEEAVRGLSIANEDLPGYYASHLLLLNDHWDSMRHNGFLSNRLFDGSAVGTPILSDTVNGLADVFGDTVSEAGDAAAFSRLIQNCLSDPDPYLERAARAKQIVHAAHTFDHRAAEMSAKFDQISFRKL